MIDAGKFPAVIEGSFINDTAHSISLPDTSDSFEESREHALCPNGVASDPGIKGYSHLEMVGTCVVVRGASLLNPVLCAIIILDVIHSLSTDPCSKIIIMLSDCVSGSSYDVTPEPDFEDKLCTVDSPT